jgi:hypothetical protein
MSRHRHNHVGLADLITPCSLLKRAHTDWRFWIGVLMLAAMIAYVER